MAALNLGQFAQIDASAQFFPFIPRKANILEIAPNIVRYRLYAFHGCLCSAEQLQIARYGQIDMYRGRVALVGCFYRSFQAIVVPCSVKVTLIKPEEQPSMCSG